jgi:hypothetical protein
VRSPPRSQAYVDDVPVTADDDISAAANDVLSAAIAAMGIEHSDTQVSGWGGGGL